MRETSEELNELQALLEASLSQSTTHLRSIVAERKLSAEQLTQVLTGMCTLAVSTVTAKGEPRISGADGHSPLVRDHQPVENGSRFWRVRR